MLINLPLREALSILHACMCISALNHKLIVINYTDHILQDR